MHFHVVILALTLAAVVGASHLPRRPVRPPPSQHPLDASEYVIGGQDATLGDWNWTVSLKYIGGGHFCGGAFIHKNWVITAAHCVQSIPASSMEVSGGMIYRNNPGQYEVLYKVSRVVLHEPFLWPKHDIALLQLASDVDTTNPYVQIIDFAPNDGYQYVGDECWIAGWGKTSYPGTGAALRQQEARMDVLSDEECTRIHGYDMVSDNLDICAYDQSHGRDSQICFGDSGSSLNCKRDGKWIAVGASAWVDGHCNPIWPTGFTRYSEYNDWINSYIQ